MNKNLNLIGISPFVINTTVLDICVKAKTRQRFKQPVKKIMQKWVPENKSARVTLTSIQQTPAATVVNIIPTPDATSTNQVLTITATSENDAGAESWKVISREPEGEKSMYHDTTLISPYYFLDGQEEAMEEQEVLRLLTLLKVTYFT